MLSYKSLRILSWIIALTLAVWLLRNLQFQLIAETITNLTSEQWIAWLLINLCIIFIFVWRWLVLTKGLALNLRFLDLLLLRQAGQTISFITPGPQFGGEPLQIFILLKSYLISPNDSVFAVAADRFFELWINFAVLLIGVIILLSSGSGLADWFSLSLIVSLLLLLLSFFAWLLIKRQKKVSLAINKFSQKWLSSSRLSKAKIHLTIKDESLNKLLTNRIALFKGLMLSIAGWLLTFLELYLVLGFFNIYVNIIQFVLILVAMRLAFLLPLPGGIGTLEAAIFWSFTALALPASSAAALLALIRFRDLVVLGSGFICLKLLQSKTVTV